MKEPELRERRLIWQGPEIKITLDQVRLPNGYELELELVHHPGASAVVPFITDDEILLIRQYRWAASEWIYEVPAGKLRPGGESPEECARRELIEEVGYSAGKLESLGSIWTTPGFSDEQIHLFVATDLQPAKQALEVDEIIEVKRMPFRRALELAREGTLRDAKSLCALMQVMLRRTD